MTQPDDQNTQLQLAVELLLEHGFDGMADAMTLLVNEAMKIERSEALGARPSQRTSTRRGYANGFKPKTVDTRVGELTLAVPQVRPMSRAHPIDFYPSALERGLRSERALSLAVAEMYIQGVSTRRVQEITRELCGLDVSSTQVSRAAQLLDEQLSAWRERELGRCPYLVVDARYEKVRVAGVVRDCSVLLAMGVREDGKRSVLGTSVSLSEAEVHWRDFLASLQERGLHGVELITSDDHKGLRAALQARFAGVAWQRCQVHLQRNAAALVPKVSMRKEVASDLRSIFNSEDRKGADDSLRRVVAKYRKQKATKLADWIEEAIPEGLTAFSIPAAHRRRLRTNNAIERLNKEIKRRTRVAGLFPNEESLLRLVTAIISEISDEWAIGRAYLNMEHRESPSHP